MFSLDATWIEQHLQRVIKDAQDLAPPSVEALRTDPTPLEFARYVAANRPVVVRRHGQRNQCGALSQWTNEYLIQTVGERLISIAVSKGSAPTSLYILS